MKRRQALCTLGGFALSTTFVALANDHAYWGKLAQDLGVKLE